MKKLFAMIMAICLVFGLVACGGNSEKTPETTEPQLISGTYNLCMIDANGTITDEETLNALGLDEDVFLTFNGDGTGIYCVEGEELDMKYDATNIFDPYAEDDDAVLPYELKDGKVVLDFCNGELYYFKPAN